MVMVTSLLRATDYYVETPDNGGSDAKTGLLGQPWATVAYAISQVPAGAHTINIGAGTFLLSTQANLALGVSIIGAGQTTTIINCTYAFSVLPSGDFTKGSIALISGTVNTNGNQTISDLTLDGGWTSVATSTNLNTATRGICIVRRGNVTLNRITVQKFWVCGIGFYAGYPFSQPTIRSDGNILMYSTVTNNGNGYWTEGGAYEGGAGVEVYGQSNLLVHDNTISNKDRPDHNSDLMARHDFCTGLKIYNNEFHKTELEGPNNLWNFGIETWNIQGGLEIYDNNFYGSCGAIDLGGPVNTKGTYDYSAKVYRNRIVRTTLVDATFSGAYAIHLEAKTDCSDIYVYENYIENYAQALAISDGSSTEINHKARIHFYKNLAVNCGWSETWTMAVVTVSTVVSASNTITDLYIENNTFVGRAGKSQYGINYFSTGTSNNIFIRNNIFYQLQNANSQGFVNMPVTSGAYTSGARSNFNITNNDAYLTGNNNNVSYTGTITSYLNENNIAVNPLFVSTTDFTLQSGSTLIDVGINVGLPYNGLSPDLGYNETNYATALSASITSKTNVLCYGQANGFATVTAVGGVPPYTYSWNSSPIQTTQTLTAVVARAYICTVKDALLTTVTVNTTITQPTALSVVVSKTDILCKDDSTGTGYASASGGTPPYTYAWLTVPIETTQTVNNLPAGTYTIAVFDSLGCFKPAFITITQPATRLALNIVSKINPIYPATNGSITVQGFNGIAPYLYNIDGGTFQSSGTFTNLAVGTHIIRILDTNTCNIVSNASLTFQISYHLTSKGKQVYYYFKVPRLQK